jgi:hypothetical protein
VGEKTENKKKKGRKKKKKKGKGKEKEEGNKTLKPCPGYQTSQTPSREGASRFIFPFPS